MESNPMRKVALERWLREQCKIQNPVLHPLTSDASFRRYYRLYDADYSWIAMDAPSPLESCPSFIALAKTLRNVGVNAPLIYHHDLCQGFLLLSDFGDLTYLKALNSANSAVLYDKALQALLIMQKIKTVENLTLAPFGLELMQQEWLWHKEWFAEKLLALDKKVLTLSVDHCFTQIAELATMQPQVFMHRDFHAGNLMWLPKQEVGVLDFQDAFIGPVTYDLVSLLRDCYIDWPDYLVTQWVQYFYDQLILNRTLTDVSFDVFYRWFDWMGIERHLKALFTFARKSIRDDQHSYLNFIPRTLNYLVSTTAKYNELLPLHDYAKTAQAAFNERTSVCAQ
ncbi:MAG: phosphotransferase [Gammaproteobacteria bacterium]|nr:phosphotransferase [Gammaproteobacteria bacterium]